MKQLRLRNDRKRLLLGLAIALLMPCLGSEWAQGNDCPPCHVPNPDYNPRYPASEPKCIIDPNVAPKPKGCYRLNDPCEWEHYVPNCDFEQSNVFAFKTSLLALAVAQAAAELDIENLQRWCNYVNRNPVIILKPPGGKQPADPCSERDAARENLKEIEDRKASKSLGLMQAQALLKACLNCELPPHAQDG